MGFRRDVCDSPEAIRDVTQRARAFTHLLKAHKAAGIFPAACVVCPRMTRDFLVRVLWGVDPSSAEPLTALFRALVRTNGTRAGRRAARF